MERDELLKLMEDLEALISSIEYGNITRDDLIQELGDIKQELWDAALMPKSE